ncbi:MAG: heme-binding protein, partial [Cobetia amphilecti]
MITRHVLTLADVNQMLDAAQKEAEANGWAVSIAVADDGGHPLGLRRL